MCFFFFMTMSEAVWEICFCFEMFRNPPAAPLRVCHQAAKPPCRRKGINPGLVASSPRSDLATLMQCDQESFILSFLVTRIGDTHPPRRPHPLAPNLLCYHPGASPSNFWAPWASKKQWFQRGSGLRVFPCAQEPQGPRRSASKRPPRCARRLPGAMLGAPGTSKKQQNTVENRCLFKVFVILRESHSQGPRSLQKAPSKGPTRAPEAPQETPLRAKRGPVAAESARRGPPGDPRWLPGARPRSVQETPERPPRDPRRPQAYSPSCLLAYEPSS